MHPGIVNLKELTLHQLEDNLNKLNRYYFISQNESVRLQIILAIDSYKIEIQERYAEEKRKQQQQNGDSGLDDLINVS